MCTYSEGRERQRQRVKDRKTDAKRGKDEEEEDEKGGGGVGENLVYKELINLQLYLPKDSKVATAINAIRYAMFCKNTLGRV